MFKKFDSNITSVFKKKKNRAINIVFLSYKIKIINLKNI